MYIVSTTNIHSGDENEIQKGSWYCRFLKIEGMMVGNDNDILQNMLENGRPNLGMTWNDNSCAMAPATVTPFHNSQDDWKALT